MLVNITHVNQTWEYSIPPGLNMFFAGPRRNVYSVSRLRGFLCTCRSFFGSWIRIFDGLELLSAMGYFHTVGDHSGWDNRSVLDRQNTDSGIDYDLLGYY